MSDDRWRDDRDTDDFSEYGSLFDDDAPAGAAPRGKAQPGSDHLYDDRYSDDLDEIAIVPSGSHDRPVIDSPRRDRREPADFRSEIANATGEEPVERLTFDGDGTDSLPHWTDPPTTELPSFEPRRVAAEADEHDDVDVWSSFSADAPVWKDDVDDATTQEPSLSTDQLPKTGVYQRVTGEQPSATGQQPRVSGQQPRVTGQQARATGQQPRATGQHRRVSPAPSAAEREPSRITIGTDPSGMPRRAPSGEGRRRSSSAPPPRAGAKPPPSSRNMPVAIGVGVALAAVFMLALTMLPPIAVLAIVTAVIGLGAVEFYERVREKGYRPSIYPGLAACIAAPIAVYWKGETALPLVFAFGFMAIAAGFIGAPSVEAGPLPNVSITVLGTIWIGLLGSYAVLILQLPVGLGPLYEHAGTDTLFLVALGVVANDTGALLAGSAFGRTPLRPWISPNKTVEGLIGGTAATILALVIAGLVIGDKGTTWPGMSDRLILAVVIAIMAPMGDLVESMFKRNLDIKDFGSLVRGHGGVLDRFDGFLFTLPAVYYLTVVLQPWVG